MSEASQKAGARDATPASSRNKQTSETAPEDSWEVEWDVYSDPASSAAEESEPGSPTALFRHTHEGPDGGRRVITAVILMAIAALSMVGQTEATVYVQRDLGWDKPYLILTAQYVEHQTLDLTSSQTSQSPLPYMLKTCFVQCCALNVAAVTWFIAANMTTPSDLTAINNTSAIFAYVFSVWLLKESMRMAKNIAVVLAVAGVLVISYGNPTEGGADEAVIFTSAFLSLTALTSPVLSSVAAMLGIFLVALYDAIFTGHDLTKATIGGGFAIIIAFLLLGWSTYQETYVENKTPNEHELTRVPTEEV
ncbi:hypothetical protein TWF788_001897 [Orbilia oligospora]|uniref:EamA domain-containing protein n=1 Tax=Orbilia oligospora TaxID=2813651 RepID=A0A6G1MFD4_ORBOL|nr:hypothetical protein TWF788_001897 [Orbilia oligospora]KAF3256475.1 hypothetical protein TWF192_001899 [Orbilia oligospora]